MMQGVVNLRREAMLTVVVGNLNRQLQAIEAVIDTGFNGVIWDGKYWEIDIAESETEPLLGMALLYGYRLQVDNIEGGMVRIQAL
jgi:energy-converting hydrogenase Eha subunit C